MKLKTFPLILKVRAEILLLNDHRKYKIRKLKKWCTITYVAAETAQTFWIMQ